MAAFRDSPEYGKLLRRLGEKDVRISELEEELDLLRNQVNMQPVQAVPTEGQTTGDLARHSSGQDVQNLSESPRRPSDISHGALWTKYYNLNNKYNDLRGAHAKCHKRIAAAVDYYNKAKDNARQWKEYLNRKGQLKSTPKAGLERMQTPTSVVGELVEADQDMTPRPVSEAKTVEPRARFYQPIVPMMVDAHAQSGHDPPTPISRSARIPSSQTTQEGSDPVDRVRSSPPRGQTGVEDEPVVVSTRSLKRKRTDSTRVMPPTTRIKQEPLSPSGPIEIRSEDYSSPIHKQREILRTDTSDLDALSANLRVSRRHKARFATDRAVSEDVIRPVPSLVGHVSSLSDSDLPDAGELPLKLKMEPGSSAPMRLPSQDKQARDPRSKNVLRPISVNLPSKVHPRDALPLKSPQRRQQEDRTKVAALSEDGEDMSSQSKGRQAERTGGAIKTHATRRLDTMLEAPTLERLPLTKGQSPGSAITRERERPSPAVKVEPAPRKIHVAAIEQRAPPLLQSTRALTPASVHQRRSERASPLKRDATAPTRPPGLEDSPPPVNAEDEPLRLRPLSSLHLHDFRINAKAMGSDYAYSETLRGRDQRRCMAGCTKPECCGNDFLKIVEMAGTTVSTKTDAEVLEAYLGSNWQELMGAYAADKRKDLLMQAHASSMANQFGKHRQMFERRSTPPGFWRTDMPSTQEAEEDRAKALAMERTKIEERWREAMREGGRWKFRDE